MASNPEFRSFCLPPGGAWYAQPDYPDAPIELSVDASTPGAELFAVGVVIESEIPLHFHPQLEFQFVLTGTGLALDATGAEIPIGPGSAVCSPAGPAGSHGFRRTGALPLRLLCVYPSPGGATPGRAAFGPEHIGSPGPISVHVPPVDFRPAELDGLSRAVILDETIAGAELHAEVVNIGDELPLHGHPTFELAWVLTGAGTAVDAWGTKTPVGPGAMVLSPAGADGAHAVRSTGVLPLQLLVIHASADGTRQPVLTF